MNFGNKSLRLNFLLQLTLMEAKAAFSPSVFLSENLIPHKVGTNDKINLECIGIGNLG